MKIFSTIIFCLFAIKCLAQPAQKYDKPIEFSFSHFNCNYNENYSQKDMNAIVYNAENGSSIAAYFLFFGSNIIKSEQLPDSNKLLKYLVDAGNPAGYEINAFELFKKKNYKEGLFYFERAAEKGKISVISYLHEIFSGKEYPKLKDKSLELYWWRRSALSGVIYELKKYIYNNPENLSKRELKPWQDAYQTMINVSNKGIFNKKYSEKTKAILYEINENREKIKIMLQKHHPWFANYKYCI